jgi:nicotinamide-nucleotide amidase
MPPRIDIVTIGTELILGRIADTNAHWLAQRIVEAGGCIRRVTTVADKPEDITSVLSDAIDRGVTHIVTTGGLGPTPDDLTVETVARLIGCGTVVDEGLIGHFRERLKLESQEEVGQAMRKVATIPEGATAGPNDRGWGHCITALHRGVTLFILPGPPQEVQALFPLYVEPALRRYVANTP